MAEIREKTRVSIVIVNWNTRDLTVACVESIKRTKGSLPVEAIVIDNDSSDGSEQALKEAFANDAWVKVIQAGENLGFGKGQNQGIKRARGEYVFILNPDTELEETTLQTLTAFMDANDDVAVAAPKLVNPDGSLQESVRRFPTAHDQSLILLKVPHFIKKLGPIERYLATDFDYDVEQEAEQPMGAAT